MIIKKKLLTKISNQKLELKFQKDKQNKPAGTVFKGTCVGRREISSMTSSRVHPPTPSPPISNITSPSASLTLLLAYLEFCGTG